MELTKQQKEAMQIETEMNRYQEIGTRAAIMKIRRLREQAEEKGFDCRIDAGIDGIGWWTVVVVK